MLLIAIPRRGQAPLIAATTTVTVPITVYNTNRGPEIVDFDNPSVNKGESTEFVIAATDGNKSSTQTLYIEVENTNRSPVIIPLPTQVGRENERLKFNLNAVDYDFENVIYSSVDNFPTGASFDTRTGEFNWKPTYEQSERNI
ncbi:MAG: putative Ig domain-containing protein [Rivularia sp. (in: cyanobacteria)]